MWKKHSKKPGLRTFTAAVLIGFASSGCGGDDPSGPELASLPELFGDQLYTAEGSPVNVRVLNDTPIIGIYFASVGCPACGAFNPILVEAYNQLEEDGRPFEVVLVSLGISDSALFEYMDQSGMPWLAVSPQSSEANALVQRYDVRWVPTLVMMDGAGNTISLNGREEVTQRGAGAYDDWLAAIGGS
jgi:hypothetical protein